jgi:hypothetical protein
MVCRAFVTLRPQQGTCRSPAVPRAVAGTAMASLATCSARSSALANHADEVLSPTLAARRPERTCLGSAHMPEHAVHLPPPAGCIVGIFTVVNHRTA